MDADEHIPVELQNEISSKISTLEPSVMGVELNRRIVFKEHFIRFGGFKEFKLLRIWRTGYGRCEQRLMDEHIVLNEGSVVAFRHFLIDENLNAMHWWVNKHNNYARREAADALNLEYQLAPILDNSNKTSVKQARVKRFIKTFFYHKSPLGLRSFVYFLYRFVFRFGFLDHPKVWIFHFMQGLWYRLLVDIAIYEIKKKSNGDVEQMKKIITQDWNIKFEE
jgi:hypothetical protein